MLRIHSAIRGLSKPNRTNRSAVLALTLCAAASAAACKGDRIDDRQGIETTTSEGRLSSPSGEVAKERGVSLVRMINALPTGGATSVTADDRALFSSVDFRTVTPYAEVTDNIARFRLQGTGRDTSIASNNEIMLDGSRYTLLALPEDDGGVRLRVLRDEFVVDSTRARLRVIHGIRGVGEIDVLLQGQQEPLFDNVNLTSEAGYEDVDARNTTLIVRADGSGRQLIRKELRMQPGHSYTVVLTGSGTQRVEAIVVDDRAIPGEDAARNPNAPNRGGNR
jgi:hypothetical protein